MLKKLFFWDLKILINVVEADYHDDGFIISL